MKIITCLTTIAIAAMALFSGCAKDGHVGPQGPQGPAGYDGNANVIGTDPFYAFWRLDGNLYTDSLIAPGITADIVNRGSVQVFIQYGGEWWVLPDVNGINTTIYGFGAGYLKLWNSNSDGSRPLSPYPPVNAFRAVIISASNRMANPNVNWKNYEEVKAVLRLQD